jgi:hypothetical protein
MMKVFGILAFALSILPNLAAADSLIGNWKVEGEQCLRSNGQPYPFRNGYEAQTKGLKFISFYQNGDFTMSYDLADGRNGAARGTWGTNKYYLHTKVIEVAINGIAQKELDPEDEKTVRFHVEGDRLFIAHEIDAHEMGHHGPCAVGDRAVTFLGRDTGNQSPLGGSPARR